MSPSKTRQQPPFHVGAIDQGTTSTRFMVFDRDGRCAGRANQRETTVVWDHRAGEPLRRALVYARWKQALQRSLGWLDQEAARP